MGMKKKKKEKLFEKEQNDMLYVTETFRLKLDVELENWLEITGNFTISGKIDRLVISINEIIKQIKWVDSVNRN